jgi:hypothetical protein
MRLDWVEDPGDPDFALADLLGRRGLERPCETPAAHVRLLRDCREGSPLFELSRFMGTSVEQIGRTYGQLLPDSLERARTALDAFVTVPAEANEARS